jgi:hypothetical protein
MFGLSPRFIKRIGDEQSTNIWTVNWLPHNTNLSPIASLKQQPSHKVSELIDGTSSSWRPDLIRETFLPMDVSIIIKYSIAYKNTN